MLPGNRFWEHIQYMSCTTIGVKSVLDLPFGGRERIVVSLYYVIDTSRVTNMANMFYHSDLITDLQLPGFDVSNVSLCFCFMNEGGTVNGRPWEEFFGL